MVTPDQKESTLISRTPVNYHVVYDANSQSILYVGNQDECHRYIRDNELEHCEVWHIYDVDVHAKPLYLNNQE